MVIREFSVLRLDGKFHCVLDALVLKRIFQVITREFVQLGMFGLMLLNDVPMSEEASSSWAAWAGNGITGRMMLERHKSAQMSLSQFLQVAMGWKGVALLAAFPWELGYSLVHGWTCPAVLPRTSLDLSLSTRLRCRVS